MDAARELKVPTLVVPGERTPLSTQEPIGELAAGIADVEAVEVGDAGHLVGGCSGRRRQRPAARFSGTADSPLAGIAESR